MKKKGTKNVPNCVPVEENASGDSSLHDWFTKSKASDGTKGWVQIGGKYAGKPCAKQPGQTTKKELYNMAIQEKGEAFANDLIQYASPTEFCCPVLR